MKKQTKTEAKAPRKFTRAGLKAISDAQKKRWALYRKEQRAVLAMRAALKTKKKASRAA